MSVDRLNWFLLKFIISALFLIQTYETYRRTNRSLIIIVLMIVRFEMLKVQSPLYQYEKTHWSILKFMRQFHTV